MNEAFGDPFDPGDDEGLTVKRSLFDEELYPKRPTVGREHVVERLAHRRGRKPAELMVRADRSDALQVPKHRRLVAHRVMDQGPHFKEQEKLLHREVSVPGREVERAKRRPEVGILVGGDRVV